MQEEKQQLAILLLIVLIGFIGTSIAYPLFPPLFLHPSAGSIVPANWPDYAKRVLLGIALAAYPFGQFVGSPILGGCSDRYGRKRILLLSLIGSMLGYLFSALSLEWNNLGLLLVSRFLTGLMEGNFSIAKAMAADLKTIPKLKSIGRVSGAAALGYVMGPLAGGFLSDKHIAAVFSFAFPFWIAVIISTLACLITVFKLKEKAHHTYSHELSLLKRFNLIARFKLLFKTNPTLKKVIIISTLFTLAVDIFYEFGPVYLTSLWSMTPAGIALYNTALSLMLVLGNAILPNLLMQHFSMQRVTIFSMLITAFMFALLVLFPSPFFAFVLFSLLGLSIGITVTYLTTYLSQSASAAIQGEAMGVQWSFRTLGDALICLVGGFIIISSVMLPLVLSCGIALWAVGMHISYKQDLR